jgi:hypothetical protein
MPQWYASFPNMTQDPPHNVEPVGQAPDEHVPAMQIRPVPQTFPHVPQLRESAVRLAQVAPQADWPAGHWQVVEQMRPPVHVVPQVPQLVASRC